MTGAAPEPQVPGRVSGRRWRAQEHRIELRGVSYRLRLVSFAAGWLASVDTVEGPTLGCDHSPYLAVSRAVEPLGGSLVEAMSIVAEPSECVACPRGADEQQERGECGRGATSQGMQPCHVYLPLGTDNVRSFER